MESFVFNSFKENLLKGNIKTEDTWTLNPVNSKFVSEYQDNIRFFRNNSDLVNFYNHNNDDKYDFADFKANLKSIDYTYSPMSTTDYGLEPEYVTSDTWKSFKEKYNLINDNLHNLFFENTGDFYREYKNKPRGFYYIKTAEELKWCAFKVNDTSYDNAINIVLGDNIGQKTVKKIISTTIGNNPEHPFEGILYGNGYKFLNIEFEANNDMFGIVGILGTNGIISDIRVDGITILRCNKKLTIEHLKTSGTDIATGIICGKNNGLLKNIYITGDVYITGFYPEIYSMFNKSDSDEDAFKVTDANRFFPDYFCYNSPGNIIPYIGYFNEGVIATYEGYELNNTGTDILRTRYWNTQGLSDVTKENINGSISPMEWYYWEGIPGPDNVGFLERYSNYARNILWYDGNIVSELNEYYGHTNGQSSKSGLMPIDFDKDFKHIVKKDTDAYYYCQPNYMKFLNKVTKPGQQNRQAYYVSTLCGINNGKIDHVYINVKAHLLGTFVGFLGGIAGKQLNGQISNIKIAFTSDDTTIQDISNIQVETKIYTENLTDEFSNIIRNLSDNFDNTEQYYTRNYKEASNSDNSKSYKFIEKSIKNIGCLFGSVIVGNKGSLKINALEAQFNNNNKIDLKTDKQPVSDDYYLMNRFGTIAAIIELNSSNISDMWQDLEGANDITNRSIYISNSKLYYNNQDYVEGTPFTTYDYYYSAPQLGTRYPTKDNYIYGVVSPLFAELKPITLSVPSIISTGTNNALARSDIQSRSFARVGLFMTDNNIASPLFDPQFWTINNVVDIPGIANYKIADDEKYRNGWLGYSFSNQLNTTYEINQLALKLICWDNTKLEFTRQGDTSSASGYSKYISSGNIFNTITVPTYAYEGINDTVGEGINHNYNVHQTYPYFGSDLVLKIETDNVTVTANLITNYDHYIVSFDNPHWGHNTYHSGETITEKEHNNKDLVKTIELTIFEEAHNYAPFTNKEISDNIINQLYKLKIYDENGDEIKFGESSPIYDSQATTTVPAQIYNYGPGFYGVIDQTANSRAETCIYIPFDPNKDKFAAPPYNRWTYIIFNVLNGYGFTEDPYINEAPQINGNPIIIDKDGQNYKIPSIYNDSHVGYYYNELTQTESEKNYGDSVKGFDSIVALPISSFQYGEESALDFFDAALKNNINASESDGEENPTYFKYTYTKSKPIDYAVDGIKLPVKFDKRNEKAGFWASGEFSNNIKYAYNDNINYIKNIFGIGETLNEACILENLKEDSKPFTLSAFSADDFEGLYVVDSSDNPVMYIDVGLGECPDGTTWSYSSYPDSNELSNITSGLFLEIN